MANAFDGSTSKLDSTFVLETSEEVKQPKKENESPKMLDSNNNSSPKVFATKSNLPVPTMRVLRSTPRKNIFQPGTPGSQAKQETKAVANEKYSFQLGDLVWAKMKGFSEWPGKIEMPPENLKCKRPNTKKVKHCVFFFGSYDYAWLSEADLRPYQEFKIKKEMSTTKNSVKKAEAIDEIEAYIKGRCKTTTVAMSKDAIVTPDQLRENRLLDEVKGLKEELDATKIRCEEMMLKDTHVQIRLSKLLEENTALKIDNLEKQRKLVLLLQINEEKDAEIEDQKTQNSSLVKTIVEGRWGWD